MPADQRKNLFLEATQHIKGGKYGQASKALKELMALEPSNIEYRRLSASLNLKLGNMISAKAVYDSLVREATQMRDFRLAESLLREYLTAGPRYVPFLELLGRVCEDNNNAMVAANEYGKALQILMEDADPGEAAHAADLLAKIRTLSPNNPVLTQYDPAKFSQTATAPSPLETALKIGTPSPPAETPPPPATPAAAPSPRRAAEDIPMVEDDLTDVMTSPGKPTARPPLAKRDIPPPPPPPPMVEDDLTELLSKPIPKRPPLPTREVPPPPPPSEEKPSLTKSLFGFLKSTPAPEPAPPPEPPAAPPVAEEPPPPTVVEPPSPAAAEPPPAPVETTPDPVPSAPAPAPQWKPWQADTEESAEPVSEPAAAEAAAAPAAATQGTEWKEWQPPAPEPSPAPGGGFVVVDSRQETVEPAPAPGPVIGASAPIPTKKRAPAAPLPKRPAPRRTSGFVRALKTLVTLTVVVAILAVAGFGALLVGCLLLEKSPTDAFRNFAGAPPPGPQGSRKNAYLLLAGFDADAGRDPIAVGNERVEQPVSVQSIQCQWEPPPPSMLHFPAEAGAIESWWQGADPIGQFQKEAALIQGWTAGNPVLLERYRRWLGMEFEDGGYGAFTVPNCALILSAHRLHVAEGFTLGTAKGIERLEQDLKAWRGVLAQARTLPVKQLAFAIFNDDLTLLAGLFSRPDVTGDTVSDLVPLAKPLEQVERSLRWSMQNALALDSKLFATSALFDAVKKPSPLVRLLAWLPLPKQRALNAYTDHFEALLKSAEQPLTKPPPLYDFAKTPAKTVMDDLANPIDNLLPSRTIVAWDQQVGMVFDTEARLRLVTVSALLRGASRKAIAGRIAAAGQKFTDPFTELPMLMNPARGAIYSVGKNRRDDDGDPKLDVAIAWPFTEPTKDTPKGRTR